MHLAKLIVELMQCFMVSVMALCWHSALVNWYKYIWSADVSEEAISRTAEISDYPIFECVVALEFTSESLISKLYFGFTFLDMGCTRVYDLNSTVAHPNDVTVTL